MLQQLIDKYTNAIESVAVMTPQDLGAVRLAMRMALDEQQRCHRENIAEIDTINAELLQDRDTYRSKLADAENELTRLINGEDTLRSWLTAHAPESAADVANGLDVAAAVIKLLNCRPAAVEQLTAQRLEYLSVQKRPYGVRYDATNEQLRTAALQTIKDLARQLGRAPTQKEFDAHAAQERTPTTSSIKNRLNLRWNELIASAGLDPNLNVSERKAAAVAARQEGKAENAESPFRVN